MAVDDPTGFNASILGEIKDIKRRLDELSAAPLGKVKPGAATNSISGFSWTGTATAGPRSWVTVTAPITVPPFATSVSILAVATSVVCSNATAGVAAFSFITITVPELSFAQSQGANVYVQSNQQAQRSRAAMIVNNPVTPGTTLTITAEGDAYNTGTNVDNYLAIDAFAIFQY